MFVARAMPTPWTWLKIDGWKSHGVPDYLVGPLIDDLNARSLAEGTSEPVVWEGEQLQRVYIDEPGLQLVNMPDMEFRVDGLAITMPTHDVGSMLVRLRKARRRTFKHGQYAGLDYYKLHGFCKCIVLTPDMHIDLLAQMETKVGEAEALADGYIARLKERA